MANLNHSETFNKDELKKGNIPDDLEHLWNILSRNPEKTVKMDSILTDLKMIRGLYPREISEISKGVYSILKGKTTYTKITYHYTFLAYCYLKYGLAGIVISKKKSCTICNEGFQYNTREEHDEKMKGINQLCYKRHHRHEFEFRDISELCSTVMICGKCGICKRFSANTPNETETIGVCISSEVSHKFKVERFLECPYEDWVDEDEHIV